MFYSGFALFGLALLVLALGLVGLTPGAGALVNVALFLSLALLAVGAVTRGNHHLHDRFHHHPRVRH